MTAYLHILQDGIRQTHGCAAIHCQTVRIRETFEGVVVWEGNVEVFDLDGHPRAQRCYAWAAPTPDSQKWTYTAILANSIINSPLRAVQVYLINRNP